MHFASYMHYVPLENSHSFWIWTFIFRGVGFQRNLVRPENVPNKTYILPYPTNLNISRLIHFPKWRHKWYSRYSRTWFALISILAYNMASNSKWIYYSVNSSTQYYAPPSTFLETSTFWSQYTNQNKMFRASERVTCLYLRLLLFLDSWLQLEFGSGREKIGDFKSHSEFPPSPPSSP